MDNMTRSNVQWVKKSANGKVGHIPTTTSTRDTCPPVCPLAGAGGCYADSGYYTRMNWDHVDNGTRGKGWDNFVSELRKLGKGKLWRHNVAGDLQGTDDVINGPALWEIVSANQGKRGFTYTHYTPSGENLEYIEGANRAGFTVNISTNTVTDALEIAKQTAAPIVTIVPPSFWDNGNRVDNVLRCPAETSDKVQCATCKLCAVSERKDIIAFTVHGARKAAAQLIAVG